MLGLGRLGISCQFSPAKTCLLRHTVSVCWGGGTVGVGVGTDDDILSFLWLWQGGCPDQLVCGSDPDLDRGVSCSKLAIRLKSAHIGVPGELRLFICLSFCL